MRFVAPLRQECTIVRLFMGREIYTQPTVWLGMYSVYENNMYFRGNAINYSPCFHLV